MNSTPNTLAELLGLGPDAIGEIKTIGYDLVSADNFRDAATLFRGLLDLSPGDLEVMTMLAISQVKLGHVDEGDRLLGGVLQRMPGHQVALVARGEARLKRSDNRGLDDLRAAVKADPHLTLQTTRRAKDLLDGKAAA